MNTLTNKTASTQNAPTSSLYSASGIIPTIKRVEPNGPAPRQGIKYDEKFGKESEATFAGVFFFLVPIMFTAFCIMKLIQYEGLNLLITVVTIGAAVIRLVSTLWVAKVSRDLNRQSFKWMAFAFLLPGTALMVIGQKKKIVDPSDWKQHLYNHNRSITAPVQTAQPTLQLAS